jgi:hypothetical protein
VVVAVVAMGMVQVPVDQVIDMITVGYRFVPTVGAVNMTRVVATAGVCRGALGRVRSGHLELMLFHLAIVTDMVQVPVMQVVDVVAMQDTGMLTVRSMLMVVMGVQISHFKLSSKG